MMNAAHPAGRDSPPVELRIRPASIRDAADLARIVSPLGYPTAAEAVVAMWDAWTAEGNSALVAELAGGVVGMITLHHMLVLHRPKRIGRITSLSVEPQARGRGIGRALVAAAEAVLADAGCGMVEVTSHTRRTEAHAFYLHIGYERTSFRFARSLGDVPGTIDPRASSRTYAPTDSAAGEADDGG